ncbi:Subtilisin-like protease [Quillaja saponaria]|uniref:Subtilisin-like protease n=1 Tax=Quillaja saponaria TaxID=32244 RepID=A0AAD7PRW1_QUISA|nr:Subtilisin-like protease [Quillaja saponaria]
MCLFWHRKNEATICSVLFSILLVLKEEHILPTAAITEDNVYIIYMERKQHHNPERLVETHHETLASVLGSRAASSDSMIYSYKHGFSGFAARLTATQAQMVAELPAVAQVIPNRLYKMQTTRSWDYLQLYAQSPDNLLHQAKMGDGVIIGLIDSGIWPESEAFTDKDLGPIPSRWVGVCESGEFFNAAKSCNRKLIGARYFIRALQAQYGKPFNATESGDYLSPRDSSGHGTHTSATAGGSFISNVSHDGLAIGTIRGGAPRARLAMYKVCWNVYGGVCAAADLLKAFDEAIHDGVDVLSVSIAADIPLYSDVDMHNGITIGAFHAVTKGITVVCAAGNDGPNGQTLKQTPSPWILTVAASTLDRSFPTPITLGNNWTIMGQAMFTGQDTGFTNLVYPEVSDLLVPRYCQSLSPNDTWLDGNVVLCFVLEQAAEDTAWSVREAGGLGLIVSKNPSKSLQPCPQDFPCAQVSYEIGMQILYYIRSTRHPIVRIRPSKTHIGKPVSTNVAYFSSRGPSSIAPAILKPDIAAPGVNILAAVSSNDFSDKTAFGFKSGTSMATPHVSGIVALLKSLHPQWSPAAIRSAIFTTAWTTDPSGEPIFAEGEPMKLANPFDFGGGIVNPNKAADPGLIYDMTTADYISYLCAMGYGNSIISHLIEHPKSCPSKAPSILDINLPSITVPTLKNSTAITRTVTNVGAVNSTYKGIIEPPLGTIVAVRPDILIFNSTIKTISFAVVIASTHTVSTGFYFGSLTWKDGKHDVRSPISVRTEITESYG